MKKWYLDCQAKVQQPIKYIVAATKTDLERVIPYKAAQAFADKIDAPHIECSAKDNINVQEIFIMAARQAMACDLERKPSAPQQRTSLAATH